MLQSKENTIPELGDLHENTLNLHNEAAAQFQLQKCRATGVADPKAGITWQTAHDAFQCQSTESIPIKDELSDSNITNIYNCSDHQHITIANEKFTDQSKGTNQISNNGRKKSIVWNYFNVNASESFPVVCTLCGRDVKCGIFRRGRAEKSSSHLWPLLRRSHVAIYKQHRKFKN
jgi:hypothetical protein